MSTVTVTLPQAAAAAPSSATLSGVLSAPAADAATATATAAAAAAASASANPLLQPWQGAHGGFPAWPAYQPAHFLPALTAACAEHIAELTALAAAPSTPTFENTVLAFDGSGRALERVSRVLQHLCSSATSPELQAVELASAPLLAEHSSRVHMGIPGLFARVAAVHAARAALPPQAARLVERVHLAFVRSGAQLDAAAQARLAEVMSALALAHTQFSQNVLKDEAECTLTATAEELEGCPPDLLAAAAAVGAERGAPAGALVLSLSRSQVEPILTYATRRDTRERLWRQWTQRGQLTPSRDNAHVIKRILLLRCEQAALHGYPSFGAYQTADSMAQSPEKVMELLDTVWPRARASAERERAALEAFAHSTGVALEGGLQPWDWRFLAERERGAKFSFDEAALKPYLSLEKVTGALFDVAGRLFGLRFVRTALQGYHPDVVVYEVRQGGAEAGEGGCSGELLGFFCADNFARPNKEGGAWMSELRTACMGKERVLPIIVRCLLLFCFLPLCTAPLPAPTPHALSLTHLPFHLPPSFAPTRARCAVQQQQLPEGLPVPAYL